MRILVLTDSYPPAATGGYERSCADTVRRWTEADHAVTVLTTQAEVPGEPGVRRVLAGPGEADAESRSADAVETALRECHPQVVTVWNLARVPIDAVLRPVFRQQLPVCFVLCDGWLADAPADLPPSPAGSVIAWVSDALRRATRCPPWAPDRWVVIPSGIDERIFGGARPVVAPERHRLLFVGRLAPAKGVVDAVAALPLLPSTYRLTVAGPARPDQRGPIDDLIREHGLADRVVLTGPVERGQLPALYAGCGMTLFPSRWAEPFGLVPLEAMACGSPVVATGTGGSADYLRDQENALLVAPGQPAGLAEAVRRLADDDLRRDLVAGGHRTWPHYTVARLATRLADLLRRAVA